MRNADPDAARLTAAPAEAPSHEAASGSRGAAVRVADAEPRAVPDSFFTLHHQDARRLELVLSQYSSPRRPLLTCTVTSPPYGGLKDYGDPSQIGFGQPHDEYLVDLRRVFRAVYRHTKPNGSLWLVADTAHSRSPEGEVWPLQMIPFELAHEASEVGWILRDVVIWLKDKTLPWSSRGRLRNRFEYVLFFVKSKRFKYKVSRLREPNELEQWWVRYPERYNPRGKAPNNVWPAPIPVQGSWANTAVQHACPLPPDLVERMLLLSTDAGDVVLDPFAGSGMVLAEAKRLGRPAVGLELMQAHIEAFHSTVLPEITKRRGVDVVKARTAQSEALQKTIVDLRVVKFPKVLYLNAREVDPSLPRPSAMYVLRTAGRRRDGRTVVDVKLVVDDADVTRAHDFEQAFESAAKKRPASKFGLVMNLEILQRADVARLHRGRRLWGYVGGQTHKTAGPCTQRTRCELEERRSRYDTPLIISNVHVDEAPRRLREA